MTPMTLEALQLFNSIKSPKKRELTEKSEKGVKNKLELMAEEEQKRRELTERRKRLG
jgi:hypothetical protein